MYSFKRVLFDVDIDEEPVFGLTLGPIYQKMKTYYFGDLVWFYQFYNHNCDNFGLQAKNIKRQMGLHQTELASDASRDNLEGHDPDLEAEADISGAGDEDILNDEDVDMDA